MSTPSKAQLTQWAQDLRDLATTQSGNATDCDSLLDVVSGLADDQTWSGTYPTTANDTITGWKSALRASATALRDEAGGWRTLATHLDAKAAAAS